MYEMHALRKAEGAPAGAGGSCKSFQPAWCRKQGIRRAGGFGGLEELFHSSALRFKSGHEKYSGFMPR
eukprot:567057-Pelagomonas_calceolata.AAC.2